MLVHTRLDDRFFDMADKMPGNCDSNSSEETVIEYYECIFPQSTMVLYSRRTGAPIAALTLGSPDLDCQTMITRRPSPPSASEAYFQGLVNMEGACFEFTISNLTPKGSINFNILHTPYRMSATNHGPAFGINEVNELGPNQSYTVRANQQNNRRMCLRGKTKTIQGKDCTISHPISVTEAESGTAQHGLYFCLSVVPEASCESLVALFDEGTVWKVVDGFAREIQVPKSRRVYRSSLPTSKLRPRGSGSSSESSSLSLHRRQSDSSAFSISSRQRRGKCPLERASMKSIGFDDIIVPKPARGSISDVESLCDNPSRSSFSRASMTSIDMSDVFAQPSQRMKRRNTTMQIPIDIGHTQAAELTHGEEVHVSSESSNRVFDFDKTSVPTVLCMSIWKEMTQNMFDGDSRGSPRRVNANKAPISSEHHDFPASNNVEEEYADVELETCLVDFTSPIDTIVVPCGHRCFYSGNLDRNITHCPLCRTPISAILPLSMVE